MYLYNDLPRQHFLQKKGGSDLLEHLERDIARTLWIPLVN